MASILIQHKVKDYTAWKKVFDANAAMRTAGGELSHQIYRDVNDPNQLTVINNWTSLADAEKFVQSPELKTAMAQAGVEGPPHITFLNEA